MFNLTPVSNAQSKPHLLTLPNQCGFTTLMIILILLMTLTTITLTSTRSSMLEQYLTGNDIRTLEIQESAEAALEFGILWASQNTLPWQNVADTLIECPTDANCPTIPNIFKGNDGGVINVSFKFERNPATPNTIKLTAVANQANNNSHASCSIGITQEGIRIPGTWRDF